MARVVVTGAAGPLGRRVVEHLLAHPEVASVVAVDVLDPGPTAAEVRRADLVSADLGPLLDGADAVIHLASTFGPPIAGSEIEAAPDVAMARRVLVAADKAAIERVVVLSTATVYGPWANNPVPLTEDAPMRPHPELAYAVQLAEVERLAAEWAADHPGAAIARLRPATLVHEGEGGWLARALHAAAALPAGDDTPAQYLHVDDLATAVVAAWEHRLDGPVNVAPDGWLTPTERAALDPVPKVRLPERVAVAAASWRWRLRLAPTPPGVLAYARHPWVVANDRLTETGWRPSWSNEEAYVAGHEARVIETISPQRRQELALGITGAGLVGAAVGIGALVRRARSRPR